MPDKPAKRSALTLSPLIPQRQLSFSIEGRILSYLQIAELFRYITVNKDVWASRLLEVVEEYIKATKEWGGKGHTGRINSFFRRITFKQLEDISAKFELNSRLIQSIQQQSQYYRLPGLGMGLLPSFGWQVGVEGIEYLILSYLSLQDFQDTLQEAPATEDTWKTRILEEIKARQQCVTVYTWVEEGSSLSLARRGWAPISQAHLGHSALRTYSGGEHGRGEYISFYHGDCIRNHRTASCRKDVSHFHTLNQDNPEPAEVGAPRAIKKPIATVTHLYGLNVVAINAAFQNLKDSQRHSKRPWAAKEYNCSDVVLSLLEKGGLFEKANLHPNPFGTIPLIAFSIIHGTLLRTLLESGLKIYALDVILKSKVNALLKSTLIKDAGTLAEKSKTDSLKGRALKALCEDSVTTFLLNLVWKNVGIYVESNVALNNKLVRACGRLLANGLINASLAALPTYLFSYQVLIKKYHDPERIQRAAISNTINASTIVVCAPFITSPVVIGLSKVAPTSVSRFLARLELNPLSDTFILGMLFRTGFFNQVNKILLVFNQPVAKPLEEIRGSPKYLSDVCTLGYKKLPGQSIWIPLLKVGAPVIAYFLFTQISKYLYETTTTPRHVLDIAKKAEKPLQSNRLQRPQPTDVSSPSSPSFLEKAWRNRYKIGLAASLTMLGMFATKKSRNSLHTSQGHEDTPRPTTS